MQKSTLWGLAVFFLSMAFFGGHLYSGDAEAYFSVALNLLQSGEPTIPEYLEGYGVYGSGGLYYAKFGLGLSILIVPFLVVGIFWGTILPVTMLTGGQLRAIALLLGPVMAGAGAVLLHRIQSRMDVSPSAKFISSLSFISAGLWLAYSKTLFSELAVAVCLLLLWDRIHIETKASSWIAAAGGGLAMLLRIEVGVIVIPLLIIHFLKTKRFFSVSVPPIFALCIIAFYNLSRFGNILEFGMGQSNVEAFSTPFMIGVIGQFFAPGNGLFVYCPFLFISLLVAHCKFMKKSIFRDLYFWSFLMGCSFYLIIHSSWHSWMGGWSWGPRRIIPLLPFIHLSVAYTWDSFSKKLKYFFLVTLAYSILVNYAGLLIDFNAYYRGQFYREDVLYSFLHSQIVGHFNLLWDASVSVDLFWYRVLPEFFGSLVMILCFFITFGFVAKIYGKSNPNVM